MNKSDFTIQKMDCPSEEQLIRMKLGPLAQIRHLDFDIPGRKLSVYHDAEAAPIEKALAALDLRSTRESTTDAAELPTGNKDATEKKILWWVLGINFGLFIVEMTTGWISHSMGLIADSLDMLADSIVYALSLFAVGGSLTRKNKVARASGYFQMGLALLGFAEVLRRFLTDSELPLFGWMIIISLLALTGNIISLVLINRAKSSEAHMQASAIFTSNDIIVNSGVIVAGILVYFLGSKWPDLIIGAIVFSFVMRGAIRILKLSSK